jgi:hypothetical protein
VWSSRRQSSRSDSRRSSSWAVMVTSSQGGVTLNLAAPALRRRSEHMFECYHPPERYRQAVSLVQLVLRGALSEPGTRFRRLPPRRLPRLNRPWPAAVPLGTRRSSRPPPALVPRTGPLLARWGNFAPTRIHHERRPLAGTSRGTRLPAPVR